jgi:hypothetical protein
MKTPIEWHPDKKPGFTWLTLFAGILSITAPFLRVSSASAAFVSSVAIGRALVVLNDKERSKKERTVAIVSMSLAITGAILLVGVWILGLRRE